MNGVGIIGAIIIGIAAGWIAEQVMKREHGLITNLIVGVVGALIGGLLAGAVGIAFGGFVGSLIVSTIGAVILLWVVGMVRKRRPTPRAVGGPDEPLLDRDRRP